MDSAKHGKVIGIGGVFFKSPDAVALRSWYGEHLGIQAGEYGAHFAWRSVDEEAREQLTVWSVFPETSKHFDPSQSPFMFNYIVDDMDALLARLSEAGVRIDPKREDHEYGRFAWIYDPDGNKVELWQPQATA